MAKTTNIILSSENQGWITPQNILDAVGPIALDPCTWPDNPTNALSFYTEKHDGLSLPWSTIGTNFINPPYGKYQIKWVNKAISEYLRGCESILLIPSRTDTKLWQTWVLPTARAVCFVRGRLKFVDPTTRIPTKTPSTFPSALVYYGKDPDSFIAKVGHLGHTVKIR